MKEYIDKEKIIKMFEESELDVIADYGEQYGTEFGMSRDAFHKMVSSIPAADVVELVHGKWKTEIDNDIGILKHTCSICDFHKFTDIHVALNWNYCPKCGAKMDLEK